MADDFLLIESESSEDEMETYRLPAVLESSGDLHITWKTFKDEFEIYMLASEKNRKSKEIQVAIFLNLIGAYGRQLYNHFNMPEEEKKDLEKIIEKFENFCSTKNVIYERFKFCQRNQKKGESFLNFLVAIQTLIRTCEYQEEDNMLRDRIVMGISDNKLREKLLSREGEMDKEKVISLCRAAEMVKQQVKDLDGYSMSSTFYIQCKDTGYVLDITDGKTSPAGEIVMCAIQNKRSQLWTYQNEMIYSKHNGLVLHIDEDTDMVITHAAHGEPNQKWHFRDDGTVRSRTGLVLDVRGNNRNQGASVIGYPRNGGQNQQFRQMFL